MTRTYSAEQNAFMLTRAQYQVMVEAHRAESIKIDHLRDTDEDAWLDAMAAIDDVIDTQAAYDVMFNAEVALVQWGHQQVKTQKKYKAQRALLEGLFSRALADVTVRGKVSDLTMQLQAA